ncbi:MAG TPA: hypothetical protein VGQ25_12500 [Gemmatimonadales bacterium]|jgi:hypothetical protein|nr:hypothetical protein [Gemmatimonadales bacterium]
MEARLVKSLKKAIAKLEAFFQTCETRPGVLARQAVGKEKAGDGKLAELLCNERRARTRMDGSIGDSLLDTAWAAWEMMDLGLDALDGGLDRLVSWVLGKVEARTAAPLPPPPLPLVLPSGLVLEAAGDAAYATRAIALRTLVRARHGGRPGVAAVVRELAQGPQPATLNLSASVLGALALAPPEHRHHLDGLIGRLGAAQGADGAWAGADLFHMLEALVLAGIRPARVLIAKAVPALLPLQRDTGAFDDPPHEERALIGLRALLVAVED